MIQEEVLSFIAVLGYAHPCPIKNRVLSLRAGRHLAQAGFGVAGGNLGGTPYLALRAAKYCDGITFAAIEGAALKQRLKFCDYTSSSTSQQNKHHALAQFCGGAILIGGAQGSANLASELVTLGKPVIAVKGSGGIVSTGEVAGIIFMQSVEAAVSYLSARFWLAGLRNQSP